jgi:hypothetical protein
MVGKFKCVCELRAEKKRVGALGKHFGLLLDRNVGLDSIDDRAGGEPVRAPLAPVCARPAPFPQEAKCESSFGGLPT